jgi:cob(I)alamin adenosyltransferase
MVRLTRIYTRTGDDGQTSLGDGQRVEKHHPRIATFGTLDELSSVLGLALASGLPAPWSAWMSTIQNDLFDLGSDRCVPGNGEETRRVGEGYTRRLEAWVDEVNAGLEPLSSFVLPGGTPTAAWMHLARTVCRRAERHHSELLSIETEAEGVNTEALRYLNRLSDLLFVLARAANDGGKGDVLWDPGKSDR